MTSNLDDFSVGGLYLGAGCAGGIGVVVLAYDAQRTGLVAAAQPDIEPPASQVVSMATSSAGAADYSWAAPRPICP